jgi:hypothetical protein
MRASEIIEALAGIGPRGAGSDGERRAALWLAREITSMPGGRTAELETFWCRPSWALAQAWHVGLGIAGSLVSVNHARVGGGIVLAALLCVIADALLGDSPGRRLTRERASQNVVSAPPPRSARRPAPDRRVTLIITANYDAGRLGLVYRDAFRRRTARARTRVAGLTPGWAGWLALALVGVLVTALLRSGGAHGAPVGVAQLIPTVALVLALALLLELATADTGPAAGDNASGTAVAIALARALDAAPPAHADVALVLGGAGDGQALGLRHHLRARRRTLNATNAIILGVGASGAGTPCWLRSDGPLVPVAYFARLRALSREVAASEPVLELREAHGRGTSPALPGRLRNLPAITLLALDPDGRPPRSHQSLDTAANVDPRATDGVMQAALLLVDAIDAHLAELASPPAAAARPAPTPA